MIIWGQIRSESSRVPARTKIESDLSVKFNHRRSDSYILLPRGLWDITKAWVMIYDSSDHSFLVTTYGLGFLPNKTKWVMNYDSSWVRELVTNHVINLPFRVSKAVNGLSRNKKDFKDSTLSHLIFQATIFVAITTSYILSRQHSTWLSTSRILSHESTWGDTTEKKNSRHRRSKYTGKHSKWTVNKLSKMFY